MKFRIYILVYFLTKFMFVRCDKKGNVIKIIVTNSSCELDKKYYKLHNNTKFTLHVESNTSYITQYCWEYPGLNRRGGVELTTLNNTKRRVIYERQYNPKGIHDVVHYSLKHSEKAVQSAAGQWKFRFKFNETKPHRSPANDDDRVTVECSTTVEVLNDQKGSSGEDEHKEKKEPVDSTIIGVVLGIVVFAQTVYIIYSKTKGCKLNKVMNRSETTETICDNNYNGRVIDIAKRPPLPLPPESEIEEGFHASSTLPSKHKIERNQSVKKPIPPIQEACTPPRPIQTPYFPPSPALLPEHNIERNQSVKKPMPPSFQEPNTPQTPILKPRFPGSPPLPPKHKVESNQYQAKPVRYLQNSSNPPMPLSKPLPSVMVPPFPTPSAPAIPLSKPDWRDSSDEEWNYEELKPSNNYLCNV